MYCCLRSGCGYCPEQVGVIICLQKTLPLRGALPVRAQRFLQIDNDLQQMNSPCNFDGYGDFSCMGCMELDAGWQRNSRDFLCIVDWISVENSLQFRGVEQRKFYWCGFCHRVADKDRNG